MVSKTKTVLLLLLLALQANAYYTMELKSTTETVGDTSILDASLINKGDESAHDVQLSLLLPAGFSHQDQQITVLKPNAHYNGTFNITINPDTISGTYPVVMLLQYKDANDYPFSMVFPESISHKQRTFSKVYGTMGTVNITGEKSKVLNITLRNNDAKEHNVILTLFLPYELSSDFSNVSFPIGPRGQHSVPFSISSFGALAGSSYTIVATLEYEDEIHYSSMIKGRVNVGWRTSPKFTKNLLFFTVIFILVVLLVLRRK